MSCSRLRASVGPLDKRAIGTPARDTLTLSMEWTSGWSPVASRSRARRASPQPAVEGFHLLGGSLAGGIQGILLRALLLHWTARLVWDVVRIDDKDVRAS